MLRYLIALLVVAALSSTVFAMTHSAERKPVDENPLQVVQSYLKATYARDYPAAYRYISSQDQRVWDEKSYARQYENFTGFALELARKLADSMQVWIIDRKVNSGRVHYEVGYQAPTADELSSLLFDWNQDKLNALSRPRQEQLRQAFENIKKNGKMITLKGQETFDLITEGGRWRIFYNWASANKVTFKIALPPGAEIEARLLNDALLVKKDEPFAIALTIKNRGSRAVSARVIHHIEPRSMEDDIDMIACGALLPLDLKPGESQEISTAYVIRNGIRPGAKLAVTYEFKLEPIASSTRLPDTGQTDSAKITVRD